MATIWAYRWAPGYMATLWGVVPDTLIEGCDALEARRRCLAYDGPRAKVES